MRLPSLLRRNSAGDNQHHALADVTRSSSSPRQGAEAEPAQDQGWHQPLSRWEELIQGSVDHNQDGSLPLLGAWIADLSSNSNSNASSVGSSPLRSSNSAQEHDVGAAPRVKQPRQQQHQNPPIVAAGDSPP